MLTFTFFSSKQAHNYNGYIKQFDQLSVFSLSNTPFFSSSGGKNVLI